MCVNCHPNRPLDGLSYLFCALAAQLRKFTLLLRRQFVLDSHQQRYLLPFDFPFRGQHFFQLRDSLLLVNMRLLGQRNEFLHFILQLPLQLGEFQLRLPDFRLEIFFLFRAQANRFLVLDHHLRGKETVSDGVLVGLLRASCSRRQQKSRANTEKPLSHFIPPFSRGLSETMCPISASPSRSLAPTSPAMNRWGL